MSQAFEIEVELNSLDRNTLTLDFIFKQQQMLEKATLLVPRSDSSNVADNVYKDLYTLVDQGYLTFNLGEKIFHQFKNRNGWQTENYMAQNHQIYGPKLKNAICRGFVKNADIKIEISKGSSQETINFNISFTPSNHFIDPTITKKETSLFFSNLNADMEKLEHRSFFEDVIRSFKLPYDDNDFFKKTLTASLIEITHQEVRAKFWGYVFGLHTTIPGMSGTIKNLAIGKKAAESKVNTLESELETLNSRLQTGENAKKTQELNRQKDRVAMLELPVLELENLFQQLATEHSSLKKRAQQIKDQLTDLDNHFFAKNPAVSNELAVDLVGFEKQMTELQMQVKNQEDLLFVKNTKSGKTLAKKSAAKNTLESSSSITAGLSDKLMDVDAFCKKQLALISKQESVFHKYYLQLLACADKSEALSGKVSDIKEQLVNANKTVVNIEALARQINESETEYKELIKKYAEIKSQFEEYEKILNDVEKAIIEQQQSVLNDAGQRVSATASTLHDLRENLANEISKMQKSNDVLKKKNADELAVARVNVEAIAKDQKIYDLELSIKEKEKTIKAHLAEIDTQKATIISLQSVLSEGETQQNQNRLALKGLQTANKTLEAKLAKEQIELRDLKATLAEMEIEIKKKEVELKQKEAELVLQQQKSHEQSEKTGRLPGLLRESHDALVRKSKHIKSLRKSLKTSVSTSVESSVAPEKPVENTAASLAAASAVAVPTSLESMQSIMPIESESKNNLLSTGPSVPAYNLDVTFVPGVGVVNFTADPNPNDSDPRTYASSANMLQLETRSMPHRTASLTSSSLSTNEQEALQQENEKLRVQMEAMQRVVTQLQLQLQQVQSSTMPQGYFIPIPTHRFFDQRQRPPQGLPMPARRLGQTGIPRPSEDNPNLSKPKSK
jgi:hypothetical protein